MSTAIVKHEKSNSSSTPTTLVVIGGGIALLIYLLSKLGFGSGWRGPGDGSGTGRGDTDRLSFVLRADGLLYLGDKGYTLVDAIHRVEDGGRKDVGLSSTGDALQGLYLVAIKAFELAGIKVFEKQITLYQKGTNI